MKQREKAMNKLKKRYLLIGLLCSLRLCKTAVCVSVCVKKLRKEGYFGKCGSVRDLRLLI